MPAHAVKTVGKTRRLRERVRARGRGGLRLADGLTLEDVGEEPELLIRRHGPLIGVLALRIEHRLTLLLLDGANIHERADVADVQLLAEFAEARHLRTKGPQTLPEGADLLGTLKTERTIGRAQIAEDLRELRLTLLLVLEVLLGLLLGLFKAGGAKTGGRPGLLVKNITAKLPLCHGAAAAAKRSCSHGLRPKLLLLHLALTSDILLGSLDDLIRVWVHVALISRRRIVALSRPKPRDGRTRLIRLSSGKGARNNAKTPRQCPNPGPRRAGPGREGGHVSTNPALGDVERLKLRLTEAGHLIVGKV